MCGTEVVVRVQEEIVHQRPEHRDIRASRHCDTAIETMVPYDHRGFFGQDPY